MSTYMPIAIEAVTTAQHFTRLIALFVNQCCFERARAPLVRSIVIDGIGRALFDRIRLLSHPGPHQRW